MCKNKLCDVRDGYRFLCPACRLMGRRGMYAGGLLVGGLVAIAKALHWI